MNSEVWKDIEGYEGLYQVSSMGQIRSIYAYGKHKTINRIIKPYPCHGHLRVQLNKNCKRKKYFVHVLVAKAFIPKIYEKYNVVNHKNYIKTDNRVENLEWVTPLYNWYHSVESTQKLIVQEAFSILKELGYEIKKAS
jgi:hypothetical protein